MAHYQQAEESNKKSIFPHKLWQMVNDKRMHSAIRWTDDGQGFLVFEQQLQNLCLGKENKLFYTKQPKSFVRQLHLYGFRKINKNQFTHQFFRRDRPCLLKNIKRSYKVTTNTTGSPTSSSSTGSNNSINNATTPTLTSVPTPSSSNQFTPIAYDHNSMVNSGQVQTITSDFNYIQTTNTNESLSNLYCNNNNIIYGDTNHSACDLVGYNFSNQEESIGNMYNTEMYPTTCDLGYNFSSTTEESILNLYNNEVYPSTCDNITL